MQQIILPHIVEQAQRLIQQADSVVVITHISPDGDAMGSSLAMRHYLAALGKQVSVIVPNEFPSFLAWIPGAKEDIIFEKAPQQGTELIEQADLIVVTDFPEPKRAGDAIGALLEQKRQPLLMIDHHLNPVSNMADVAISHPECSSACELVYRLITQMGGMPEQGRLDWATAVYTGMMTDTGNFQYNSNNPDLYEIVADLMRVGVDKDNCYDKVFNQFHEGRLRLVGYCLFRKMRIFRNRHVALVALSADELKRFNFQSGDAEGIVNMPLQMKRCFYSCFMREDTDKIKISFRSQGDRPVNEFAHACFGGGGHKNAAGGEFYGTLTEAVNVFLDNYETFLKEN